MAKIISLFNHKGGVSKTTTTFHLGWMLASMGKKVLMVDADPQCNLTGLALGIEDYDSLFKFYDSKKNDNIYDCSAHIFGMGKQYNGNYADPTKTKKENLFILAGHINFAKLDLQISGAILSSSSFPQLRKSVGAIYHLINNTIAQHNFDVVLVDMSPSLSGINQSILMASDYCIIPTSPDFFCYQAIDSMSRFLPEWSEPSNPNGAISKFKDGIILPKENPKVLGIVLSNYRVYTTDSGAEQKEMSKAYKGWSDKIEKIFKDEMIRLLSPYNMIETGISNHTLALVQDFNSLMPISQSLSKPMFAIEEKEYPSSGAIWQHAEESIKECEAIYKGFADKIIPFL